MEAAIGHRRFERRDVELVPRRVNLMELIALCQYIVDTAVHIYSA
jgi:hypothetical protein